MTPELTTEQGNQMELTSTERVDKRRHARIAGNRAIVRAAWMDQGGLLKMGQARLIDVSEGGLALELPDIPKVNSVLRFQCEKFQLYGLGSVKYASGGKGRCVVGLQFAAGSFWMSAETRNKTDRQMSSAEPRRDWSWDWNFAEAVA